MDWFSWIAGSLIVLSVIELFAVEAFAETAYRFGPVVWRDVWYGPASFGRSDFKTEHGVFSPTSSGDILFRIRHSLA